MATNAIELGIDTDAISESLQRGWSVPTHYYWDPDIYQFEQDFIYGRSWQYIAPKVKLSRPGDCVVGQAGHTPIVITCGEDGRIRGFVNVCRHRGHPVVGEDDSCRALVCPYHCWTYHLDGTLKRAPGTQNEPEFQPEDLSLIRVSVDVWGPAVFVNPDPDAMPFREEHPRFEEVASHREFDLNPEAYPFHRRIVYDAEANWKLWYDNIVECYHCPRIHGESFSAAYNVAPDSIDHYWVDRILSYRFMAQAAGGEDELRSENYRSIQVFPEITMIQQDDLMVLSQIIPLAPGLTRSIMDYFGERGSDSGRVERWVALWDQTFREDLNAARRQHQGLRSGRVAHSRFVTTREQPLIFINQLVCDAYRQGLDAR